MVAAGWIGIWYKFSREVSQPDWVAQNGRDQFLYGSAGAEKSSGMPYWIWLVLPRIFPEYMPGTGGYASLGFSWEETIEMPVGFSKKTVGYVRPAGNCAICHAYSKSNGPDAAPTVFSAGMGHTAELDKLMVFYKKCAEDPRFNADDILSEVNMATKLSLLDRLIYRFVLIPRTRQRILHGEPMIIDAALWQHSHRHAGPGYRSRLEPLKSSLSGEEKTALSEYLKTLP